MKLIFSGHEEVCRKDGDDRFVGYLFSTVRINALNRLYFIAPKVNAYCVICVSEEDIDRISLYAKCSPFEFNFGSAIEDIDKSEQQAVAHNSFPDFKLDHI